MTGSTVCSPLHPPLSTLPYFHLNDRSEFKKITGGGRLMRLDMLLEWKEVRELIEDGVITSKQISKMFDGMPKEPMGIPATTVGFAEDTFVAFNGMLDVLLDVSG